MRRGSFAGPLAAPAILAVVLCFGGCRIDTCRSPEGHRRYLQEHWEVLHELVAMWREDAPRGMIALFDGPGYKPWIDDGGIEPPPDRIEHYHALMREAGIRSLRGSREYLEFALHPPGIKRYVRPWFEYRWCGLLLLLEPQDPGFYSEGKPGFDKDTRCQVHDMDFKNWKTFDCGSVRDSRWLKEGSR